MNSRRNFLKTLLAAGAGFTVLPPATTYARVWRAQREPLKLVPFWYQTACHERILSEDYIAALGYWRIESFDELQRQMREEGAREFPLFRSVV